MSAKKFELLKNEIFEAYMTKTPGSKKMYERACESLQGGVCSSTKFFEPYPFYTTHGKGSKFYDIDGNEYIDCHLNAGPLILGHCHPEVMEAAQREMKRGFLVQHTELAVECAELIKDLIPCAEKVRFVSTGIEANLYAVRAAKAFTGKNKIIKFYGQFHGMDDQFLKGIGNISDDAAGGGIPEAHLKNTVMLRYNDIGAVKLKLDEDHDIACIIMDPQCHAGGIWPPTREYLTELRQLTAERGVMLIFDEIITGFRLAPGGAQEYWGIKPDLVALAKGMGNGAKVGVVAGRENVMDTMTPSGYVYAGGGKKKVAMHGGTYADGTVGLAAAIAALKVYKKLGETGEYKRIFQKTETLKKGIDEAFQQKGIPLHINVFGPSLKMYLTDTEPSFELYSTLDRTVLNLFLISMMTEGVWLTNPSVQSIFLSFAHTDDDIQTIIEAVHKSLDNYDFKEVL